SRYRRHRGHVFRLCVFRRRHGRDPDHQSSIDAERAVSGGFERRQRARRSRRAGRRPFFFCHGTTVGTNALLEEKGARTGLLVTKGFRGIYEVMEQTRGYGPATYDLFFEKPRLLAPPY